MSTVDEKHTLASHLEQLAMTADDVKAMITRSHEEGEIHPDVVAQTEQLASGLRDVVNALMHNEHLAIGSDDVWKALMVKHGESNDGTIT